MQGAEEKLSWLESLGVPSVARRLRVNTGVNVFFLVIMFAGLVAFVVSWTRDLQLLGDFYDQDVAVAELGATVSSSGLLLLEAIETGDTSRSGELLSQAENFFLVFERFRRTAERHNNSYDLSIAQEANSLIGTLRNDLVHNLALLRAGRREEALAYFTEVLRWRIDYLESIVAVSRYSKAAQIRALRERSARSSLVAKWGIGVLGSLGIGFALLASLRLSRSIRQPLDELVGTTESIQQGDLGKRVEPLKYAEFDSLGRSLNSMMETLASRKELLEANDRLEKALVDLRDAQTQLLRDERLAAIGQVTATVSHELRNPMGTITNSLYSLSRKIGEKPPEIERIIERIGRSVGRCVAITDDLLEFARLMKLRLAPTSIDTWLEELLSEWPVPAGISLRQDLGVKIEVPIDRDRLRRAMINVLDNAAQALEAKERSSPNGEFLIAVRSRLEGDRLELAVRDTGVGMSEEVLLKVFEPLFTTKTFGIGLGLPTVKQIMEQHGGDVQISSQTGRGTTVALWLPLAGEAAGEGQCNS